MNHKEDYISLDDLLKVTLAEMTEEELNSIPTDDEIDNLYPVSDDFQKRMAILIRKQHYINIRRSILRAVKRTAAVFLIILLLFGGLLVINEDVRAAVKAIVTEWFEKYTSFTFRSDGETEMDYRKLRPAYLPEGYDRMEVVELGMSIIMRYHNQMDKLIEIEVSNKNHAANIDNEHTIKEDVEVNGKHAELYRSINTYDMSYLIYTMYNDSVLVKIKSCIDSEELLRIGENIKIP